MRTIIAGSRRLGRATDEEYVKLVADAVVKSGFVVDEVVSGGARGVDLAGEVWAKSMGVPFVRFPADWDRYGKGAGPKRNYAMALYADALIAIWDGASSGTRDMIRQATEMGLKVYVYRADMEKP